MPGRRLGVEGPENNSAEKFNRGTRKTRHNFAELPSREIRIMRFGPDSGLAQGYLEKCLGVEATKNVSGEKIARGTGKTSHNFAEFPLREIRIMRFGLDSGLSSRLVEKSLGSRPPKKNRPKISAGGLVKPAIIPTELHA